MTNVDHCIDVCNKLLRGERSAVETYDTALRKFGENPEVAPIRMIRDDHAQAVGRLEDNVRSMGGTPENGSGTWGGFANTVQKTASLLGEKTALQALKAGEEKGRNDYRKALEDDQVMPASKELFRELLPLTERHIDSLVNLQKAA